jgi:hypothetical protein
MRTRLLAAVVGAVGLLAASLLVASPGSALPSPYSVSAVWIDAGPVTVAGLTGHATAQVSATIASSPAVNVCANDSSTALSRHVGATLSRVSGGVRTSVDIVLDLASGTTAAGTWTGTWRIGSGYGGNWQVSRIYWCNGQLTMSGSDGYQVDPRVDPGYTGTLQVVATAPPRITVTRIPAIAAFGAAQSVRVVYANNRGTPLAGRKVTYGVDDGCGGYPGVGGQRLTLDARGGVTVRLRQSQCLALTEPQVTWVTASTTVIDFRQLTRRMYYMRVSGRPASTTFRVGTNARVATYVNPAAGRASLQVLYGRTWRTLSTKTFTAHNLNLYVPSTVRATLVTGTHPYRVSVSSLPPFGDYLATTTSVTFTMIGR